ncbi:MAG: type II toxin-antitoxin system PemK/MazF family toxin [Rhodoferax sp.]|nr:type II toxin-antitoxin system PemK/MazF family toxin [Rhodoferax sp.]NCP55695.1 type II toxin-antitoxin system PemK/MazF family toxin [Rhodoferax sp.]OIP17599.1 MAG: transcription elongation factor GreAB [Comamonadaceae bacterium CG2_30_59_20]PJC16020.1 MAG: type II toxin-antitoxin system PemK/MazF family toxin [Comamonadaceae bacterium CG_4_9_14_0_8_um_filter_60_18]
MVSARVANIRRYGLYWANLDPTRGSEIAKTRPVLVVSPDAMNQRVDTVVVCPLTSQLHPQWASRVACDCDGRPSEVAVDQIRTVSKSRLGKTLGKLDSATAAEVRAVIRLLYAEI